MPRIGSALMRGREGLLVLSRLRCSGLCGCIVCGVAELVVIAVQQGQFLIALQAVDDQLFDHVVDHGEQRHAEQLHRELMNTARFGAVSEIFKQLSDPTRVRIFWLLSHQEECVVNIAALLDMSSPAVFHHLRSLTESGLLVSRRDGKEVYYRAADTGQIRLLHEIVEQVMEIACPERTVDFQASQESIIRHVHDELTANLSERVTIEELSRKYLMNATTLKRVFKQVYGETIAAHIKKHRMEAAATRLRTTQDDVAAIAQAVGYESQSKFTAAFKEYFGALPKEYRKNH